MKKNAEDKYSKVYHFDVEGTDRDQYVVDEEDRPLSVEWQWRSWGSNDPNLRGTEGLPGKEVVINKITNPQTGEVLFDAVSNKVDDRIDYHLLASWIAEEESMSDAMDRDHEEAFGLPDNDDEAERFEPREYHRMIEKKALRQKSLDELEGEEELFDIPDSMLTPGTQRAYAPEMAEAPKDEEEEFEEQFGDIGTGKPPQVDEQGNVIPEVEEEEGLTPEESQSIEKDAFLPLEEVRLMAPLEAEEFGYDNIDFEEGPNGSVVYKSYIMPAASRDRIELKGLLTRLYQKTKESSGGSWNKDATLAGELKEVDTLNDLEIKHALQYYKKIDRIAGKKIQHAPGEKYLDSPEVYRVNN